MGLYGALVTRGTFWQAHEESSLARSQPPGKCAVFLRSDTFFLSFFFASSSLAIHAFACGDAALLRGRAGRTMSGEKACKRATVPNLVQ